MAKYRPRIPGPPKLAGTTTKRMALAAGAVCCMLLALLRVVVWPSSSPDPQSEALLAFKVSVSAGRATLPPSWIAIIHAQSLNHAVDKRTA